MARKNAIEMYSTHNEGKPSVPKSFIRALKNKIYKYMTAMWKDVYIDKLNDICVIFRISKYKNIFPNGYVSNWSEEFLAITKVKNSVLLTYVISDLYGEEIVRTFYKKWLQKANLKEFGV